MARGVHLMKAPEQETEETMKPASITIKKNKTYLGPQSLPVIDFLPFSFFLSLNQQPTTIQNLAFADDSNIHYSDDIKLNPEEILLASSHFAVDMCTIMGQGVQVCQEKGSTR